MDTNSQFPTMWTTGYLKNGMKVSFTFPIRNEMEATRQALEITNKLLADGFLMTEPGLEAGESSYTVTHVARRTQRNKKDNSTSPIIDIYHDDLSYSSLKTWLNTAEEIAAFQNATGLKLELLQSFPGTAAIKRGESPEADGYVVKLAHPAKVIWKANPEYIEGSTTEAKRIFVRWEAANVTPAPQPAETAKPEPARAAELRNEMLTITRIEPRADSKGWYGFGLTDGLETRVNLFAPEDPKAITAAGYRWVTSGAVEWPVILKIQDNRLRIDTVTPQPAQDVANGHPDAIAGQVKHVVSNFLVNLTKAGTPCLIFGVGDKYAYAFTRKAFEEAGYDVTNWKNVGNHEMTPPAEITCSWDKKAEHLKVDSAIMVTSLEKTA